MLASKLYSRLVKVSGLALELRPSLESSNHVDLLPGTRNLSLTDQHLILFFESPEADADDRQLAKRLFYRGWNTRSRID